MTRFFIILLALIFTVCAEAQHRELLHIRGYVTDATTLGPVPGVVVSAVQARHSAVSDVNGFFSLELLEEVKPGDDVRIHIEKQGYRADDLTEAASESVTYPIKISSLRKVASDHHPASPPSPSSLTGQSEATGIGGRVDVLRIPGPDSGARVVRFATSGASNQKVSTLVRPQKLLFEPPGVVIEQGSLPKDLNIAGRKITIVAFVDDGFIADSHGMANVAMGAYVLEAIPVMGFLKTSEEASSVPPSDVHEQLVGGKLAQGWTVTKHGDAWTIYFMMNTDSLTPVLGMTINTTEISAEPAQVVKLRALWREVRERVPAPRVVATDYGVVEGQELLEHVTYDFATKPSVLTWTYEITRNGTGITPKPQVFKDVALQQLSSSSHDMVDDLDSLTIHTVNRRYIDAMLELTNPPPHAMNQAQGNSGSPVFSSESAAPTGVPHTNVAGLGNDEATSAAPPSQPTPKPIWDHGVGAVTGGILPSNTSRTVISKTVKDLKVEITSCQRRRGKVVCDFTVTNLLDDHEYWLLGQAYETVSRAVDERGGMFPADEVRLGDQVGQQYARTTLPSAVSVRCGITFSGIPEDIKSLSLVELHFAEDWGSRSSGPGFKLRDVPIQ